MKRICLVVQSYYLRDPRVRREAEALVKAGYEVDVICLNEGDRPMHEVVNSVNITRLPITRRRATVWRYLLEYSFFFAGVTVILGYRLLRKRYDLIHVNNMPDFLVFSTVLPKLFGSKILLDVHDPMAEVFMSKYDIKRNSPIIRLLTWQEKISLRYCHHVLTVSDVMRERLQHNAGYTPISVVLNVPDEAIFMRPEEDLSIQKSHKYFTLLYTGTISARYGLAVAIEASAKLRNEIPGLRLLLVGEGDDLPYLREMVDRLELNDIVEFRQPLPLSEIPKLIAESDVGISPHINDVFMNLYFSTKVAEFVNMGLPTVVTRTRTIERYFDDEMVKYCEAGNVESFTSAVIELYKYPEIRRRMSQKCREFADHWSWASEKQQYLNVVSELVGDEESITNKPIARVLIFLENLPVTFDRRVKSETRALTEAGYHVSVICPAGPNEPLFDTVDDVDIYRYPPPKEGGGKFGYLWEYAYSMIASFRLSRLVHKRNGFDVIQACNPPDTFFLIGRYYKTFYKKPFIFDHHDLSPELYSIRFNGNKKSLIYRVLMWLEKCTFNAADVVMSVNESVKALAVGRGKKNPDSVFIVRNAPDLSRFKPAKQNPELRLNRKYLVCYVGVMAAQDGLEYLLEAISHVINTLNHRDITFTIIGFGERLESLKQLAKNLGIDEYVVFTGRVTDDKILTAYLSTADLCVAPDPKNDMNDKCTLIKITEYMAMGKPVVAFDLTESRYTALDAAVYATPNDTAEFGDRIVELLADPERRKVMGESGRKRVAEALSWEYSKRILYTAYEAALNNGRSANK